VCRSSEELWNDRVVEPISGGWRVIEVNRTPESTVSASSMNCGE